MVRNIAYVKFFNSKKYLSLQSRFGNTNTKNAIDRSPITVLYTVIFLKTSVLQLGLPRREAR